MPQPYVLLHVVVATRNRAPFLQDPKIRERVMRSNLMSDLSGIEESRPVRGCTDRPRNKSQRLGARLAQIRMPLVGEGWGGGTSVSWLLTPTLTLPHPGGGNPDLRRCPLAFSRAPTDAGRVESSSAPGLNRPPRLEGCPPRLPGARRTTIVAYSRRIWWNDPCNP